jgi:hypothetical protein
MAKPIPMLKNSRKDEQKSTFLDFLDEGAITDWLSDNGKSILYGLIGLIALLVIIFAISSGGRSKAEQEYIQAANDFTYFSKAYDAKNPAQANDALARLNHLMSKHPELHAAYDGALAQTLLNRAQVEEAKPYALATLKRVKSNNLPFYNDYAETTLMISQGQFKEALENTLSLQQKMEADLGKEAASRSFGDELFALNLLRVAMLQQAIGDKNAELRTWQQWKEFAGLGSEASKYVNPQAFRSVIQNLAIGSISLADYISYRENILKN